MKIIDLKDMRKLPTYNVLLDRPDCDNEEGYYTVMFFNELAETFHMTKHCCCDAADRKFRSLLVKAQRQGCCCRILLVADDNCEVQRCELTSYS